jgi:ubiquitin carboxyl-terminal hydrolase 8
MTGLNNLGNTCYLNAVIQCLLHSSVISKIINSQQNINYIQNKNISNSLFISINKFYNKFYLNEAKLNTSVSPSNIRNSIIRNNSMFNNSMQHDSHELLIFLYDKLTTELSRKVNMNIRCNKNIIEYKTIYTKLQNTDKNNDKYQEYKNQCMTLKKKYINDFFIIKSLSSWKSFFENNYSDFINLLYGQLLSSINCDDCLYLSIKFDPFSILSIDIPQQNNLTLINCIKNFIQKEKLTLDEQWKCPKCNKVTNSSKQFSYWNLPKLLTIHLKRFKFINQLNIQKNDINISIPIELIDLSEYISENNYENTSSKKYECVGIICHTGCYLGGHYFSFCKKNNDWYLCNDSTYKKVILNTELVNKHAYILFYEIIE